MRSRDHPGQRPVSVNDPAGRVVLIPRSSLTSGRIGEPSHSQPNPWKELSQLAPAGEQIAQFGGKKAVQIQQPIADQADLVRVKRI